MQNLIDLAGSESSRAETTGLRRKEGAYINKSLLTLGTVWLILRCCLAVLKFHWLLILFLALDIVAILSPVCFILHAAYLAVIVSFEGFKPPP